MPDAERAQGEADPTTTVPRVYFLGSGSIAVPALAAIAAAKSLVLVGCGTQPDRPQGRRKRLMPTPVGAWCAEHGLNVDKPESVNRQEFLDALIPLNLDMVVVFAFGQILKDNLLHLPRLGCVNIHASLLPKYRGAAPVNAALLHGERETGISIMRLVRGLDAGPLFARVPLAIQPKENAIELEQRLADLAANRVCPILTQIAEGRLSAEPQDDAAATYAPKLQKNDGRIDWQLPAVANERQVRAYQPWPGAWFRTPTAKGDKRIVITAASVVDGDPHAEPGSFLQADTDAWIIACGEGALRVERLIPEGRKEMTSTEYLRGRPLPRGSTSTA